MDAGRQLGPLAPASGVEGQLSNPSTGARIPGCDLARRVAVWWRRTVPVRPDAREALNRRWNGLPDHAKTPEQVLGRNAVGCEGTHGVFPKCNLTCTPCYHSADANKVRTDGAHTAREVERQMEVFQKIRGPRAHAQLIGGEVSLLDPDAHAAAIQVMRQYGREPMGFTHGDFDEAYLRNVVLDDTGKPRIRRISFAAHFDSLMRGRRGMPRPKSERDLMQFREEFVSMFRRLRREHGVRFFLAHNMTITGANIGEVAAVVEKTLPLGFGMLSFQPAAYVGDERRWRENLHAVTPDQVWREIERGAGCPLPWEAVQFGDPRCNRTAIGWLVGSRWVPLLEPDDPRDIAARDRFLDRLGGMQVGDTPWPTLTLRLIRALLANSDSLMLATGWAKRAVRRSGGLVEILRHGVRPMTFVMHVFMDASDVAPAWSLLEQGIMSDEPHVRETQERLQACAYAMAHPDDGRVVPACVQHSVLDPDENAKLRQLLPIVEVSSSKTVDRAREEEPVRG